MSRFPLILIICSFFSIPALSGTLGECPNRGDRCYLEVNGISGFQPNEDWYFAGGEKEARRFCLARGGQYISNLSGPDYCSKPYDLADCNEIENINMKCKGDDGKVYKSRLSYCKSDPLQHFGCDFYLRGDY